MRVAVVGLGSAGRRHTRHLVGMGHCVVGFDPEAPPPVGIEVAASVEAAVTATDAVVVASPSIHHAEHAMIALNSGKPVLVEKPLAVSVNEAQRVADAATAAGVVCGVAMNMRFHPGILALRRLVDDGVFGGVLLATASFGFDLRLWRPGTDYRRGYSAQRALGGGIVLDAIHELDYLRWLLGPVEAVTAETDQISELEIDVEDVALALLRFSSGALGIVDVNFFEPAYRRGCTLVGRDAVARWDWTLQTVTVSRAGRTDLVENAECDLEDVYRQELVDFVAAIQRGSQPRTPAKDGLDAVRIADAIHRSSRLGARVTLDNLPGVTLGDRTRSDCPS